MKPISPKSINWNALLFVCLLFFICISISWGISEWKSRRVIEPPLMPLIFADDLTLTGSVTFGDGEAEIVCDDSPDGLKTEAGEK